VTFLKQRIEEPLLLREEFDKAFISFTLHGFENEDKERVIANVHRALKPGGIFWILDYNEFDLDRQWLPFRWAFRHLECELASEFLSLDMKEMLARYGFGGFMSHLFLRGYMRLLGAEKQEALEMGTRSDRVKYLERQIEELKSRWPAHSVPPAMLQQLDELEEELERELRKAT
jgi:SAM-dependent methyltransferase